MISKSCGTSKSVWVTAENGPALILKAPSTNEHTFVTISKKVKVANRVTNSSKQTSSKDHMGECTLAYNPSPPHHNSISTNVL